MSVPDLLLGLGQPGADRTRQGIADLAVARRLSVVVSLNIYIQQLFTSLASLSGLAVEIFVVGLRLGLGLTDDPVLVMRRAVYSIEF